MPYYVKIMGHSYMGHGVLRVVSSLQYTAKVGWFVRSAYRSVVDAMSTLEDWCLHHFPQDQVGNFCHWRIVNGEGETAVKGNFFRSKPGERPSLTTSGETNVTGTKGSPDSGVGRDLALEGGRKERDLSSRVQGRP